MKCSLYLFSARRLAGARSTPRPTRSCRQRLLSTGTQSAREPPPTPSRTLVLQDREPNPGAGRRFARR
ncbi:hypothetical protein BJX65DRAFT_15699 [Aspergillus insuetus]